MTKLQKAKKKQLANLQPGKHTEGLKKGGAVPRATLTQKELDFCSDVARHGVAMWACRANGIPLNRASAYRKRLQWKIDEMVSKYADAGLALDLKRRAEYREIAHHEFTETMPAIKSHKYRGLADRHAYLTTMLKMTGDIQPVRISAQASSAASSGGNAQTKTGLFAKRLYLPEWRRETIEKLQNEALSSSPSPTQA